MDSHVKDIARELTRASDENRIAFPAVLQRMSESGIERYHTDLVTGARTYFMPDGGHETTQGHALVSAAAVFSADAVVMALRAIQRGEIDYRTFCDRIGAAGCVGYLVSIAGRCVLYYGRGNDSYTERFPDARP